MRGTTMAPNGTIWASTRVMTVTDEHITSTEDHEFTVIIRVRTGRRERNGSTGSKNALGTIEARAPTLLWRNVCTPSKFKHWNPSTAVKVVRGGAFGALSLSPHSRRTQQDGGGLQARRRALTRRYICPPRDLGLPSQKNCGRSPVCSILL